jgi:hypothetical protein
VSKSDIADIKIFLGEDEEDEVIDEEDGVLETENEQLVTKDDSKGDRLNTGSTQ